MKMEQMKSKMKGGIFTVAKESSFNGRSNNNNNHNMNGEELEIRPGGMLVQKRDSNYNNQNSVPVPIIKVRVKYGSSSQQICISSQASFGELKKMLAERTGVHHQDQKLVYKKKERDSKAFLDVAGIKDGSKITLMEDITSRQRRCLEELKSARVEKASKLLQQITSQVDELRTKVVAMEATNSKEKIAVSDADNLSEILMNILVELDGIVADGDLKSQKGLQEKRVQNYIETLDKLKLQCFKGKTTERSEVTEKIPLQKQENPIEELPMAPLQKQKKATIQMPLQNSEPFLITTKWETFD